VPAVAGFGLDREVTEQAAALRGLASLGGAAAKEAVTRLIVSSAVRGPGVRWRWRWRVVWGAGCLRIVSHRFCATTIRR